MRKRGHHWNTHEESDMRVIERKMLDAIRNGTEFKSGNTSVHHDPVIGDVEIEVRLHGHLIAKRFVTGWQFNLCGWNTPTTRSRLSALIGQFVYKGIGVSTKRGQAFVCYRDGNASKPVGSNEWFAA
jgi:hypothetical protein